MALQEVNTHLKSWIEVVTLIGGIIAVGGGLIAAFKAIHELRQSREQRDEELRQRVEELRWKQANIAKELLDELFVDNGYSANAVLMLDWNKGQREYIVGTNPITVSYDDVLAALGKEQSKCADKKEIYIRECFDFFFYFIDRMQHYINIKLTNAADFEAPLKPYAEKIKEHSEIYKSFIKSQDYGGAAKLLGLCAVKSNNSSNQKP